MFFFFFFLGGGGGGGLSNCLIRHYFKLPPSISIYVVTVTDIDFHSSLCCKQSRKASREMCEAGRQEEAEENIHCQAPVVCVFSPAKLPEQSPLPGFFLCATNRVSTQTPKTLDSLQVRQRDGGWVWKGWGPGVGGGVHFNKPKQGVGNNSLKKCTYEFQHSIPWKKLLNYKTFYPNVLNVWNASFVEHMITVYPYMNYW